MLSARPNATGYFARSRLASGGRIQSRAVNATARDDNDSAKATTKVNDEDDQGPVDAAGGATPRSGEKRRDDRAALARKAPKIRELAATHQP
jgi:hypothetical protein